MDLTTTYMGLQLKNPIVPSASPLSREIANIRAMEDAGASAVVFYSLFEEQISHEIGELDHFLSYGTESFAESLSYFPEPEVLHRGPDAYLEHIAKAKEAVDIPIIASLNGVTTGGWVDYARKMQDAGADAIELNVYYIPTDPELLGNTVEQTYIDTLTDVKSNLSIPVAMKLSPFFSSLANVARRLDEAGADALVLFNRFYQPDIELEELEVTPNVILSTPQAMRLPLRWIAILNGKIKADLAATSGIHTAEDVVKMLMVGAKVTMMCSALLQRGVGHMGKVLEEVEVWMDEHEYESVSQMQGSMSQQSCADPTAFERANYMKALSTYK